MKKSPAFIHLLSWFILLCFSTRMFAESAPLLSAVPMGQPGQAGRAVPISAWNLEIPREWGTETESFGQGNSAPVIYIQDAHCDYGAQKSIAALIENLSRKYRAAHPEAEIVIALEGASAQMDLEPFRPFAASAPGRRVSDFYRRKGLLSGAEWAALDLGVHAFIRGVETPELYRENRKSYTTAAQKEPEASGLIQRLKAELEAEKRKIYSPTLLLVDQAESEFYGHSPRRRNLLEYMDFLIRHDSPLSMEGKGAWAKRYPHLWKLNKIRRAEEKVNFAVLRNETEKILSALNAPSGGENSKWARKWIASRKSDDYAGFFGKFLKSAPRFKIHLRDYPEVRRYARYLRLSDEINGPSVFEELDSWAEAVKTALYRSPLEKAKNEEGRLLRLAEKVAGLGAARSELEAFEKLRRSGKIPARLESALKPALKFYADARLRDRAIFENLRAMLSASDGKSGSQPLVFLVTGGFHGKALGTLFREYQIPYRMLAPRFQIGKEKSLYPALMRGRVSPLDKLAAVFGYDAEKALEAENRAPVLLKDGREVFYRIRFNADALKAKARRMGGVELVEAEFSSSPFADESLSLSDAEAGLRESLENCIRRKDYARFKFLLTRGIKTFPDEILLRQAFENLTSGKEDFGDFMRQVEEAEKKAVLGIFREREETVFADRIKTIQSRKRKLFKALSDGNHSAKELEEVLARLKKEKLALEPFLSDLVNRFEFSVAQRKAQAAARGSTWFAQAASLGLEPPHFEDPYSFQDLVDTMRQKFEVYFQAQRMTGYVEKEFQAETDFIQYVYVMIAAYSLDDVLKAFEHLRTVFHYEKQFIQQAGGYLLPESGSETADEYDLKIKKLDETAAETSIHTVKGRALKRFEAVDFRPELLDESRPEVYAQGVKRLTGLLQAYSEIASRPGWAHRYNDASNRSILDPQIAKDIKIRDMLKNLQTEEKSAEGTLRLGWGRLGHEDRAETFRTLENGHYAYLVVHRLMHEINLSDFQKMRKALEKQGTQAARELLSYIAPPPGPENHSAASLGQLEQAATRGSIRQAPAISRGILKLEKLEAAYQDLSRGKIVTGFRFAGNSGGWHTADGTFYPSTITEIASVFARAELKPGEKVLDLGSGDGRVVFAAAYLFGAEAHGYETDRELREVSETMRSHLAARPDTRDEFDASRAKIFADTFLSDEADWSQYDVIFYYDLGMDFQKEPGLVEKFKAKLQTMKPGARFIIHHNFSFADNLLPFLEPIDTLQLTERSRPTQIYRKPIRPEGKSLGALDEGQRKALELGINPGLVAPGMRFDEKGEGYSKSHTRDQKIRWWIDNHNLGNGPTKQGVREMVAKGESRLRDEFRTYFLVDGKILDDSKAKHPLQTYNGLIWMSEVFARLGAHYLGIPYPPDSVNGRDHYDFHQEIFHPFFDKIGLRAASLGNDNIEEHFVDFLVNLAERMEKITSGRNEAKFRSLENYLARRGFLTGAQIALAQDLLIDETIQDRLPVFFEYEVTDDGKLAAWAAAVVRAVRENTPLTLSASERQIGTLENAVKAYQARGRIHPSTRQTVKGILKTVLTANAKRQARTFMEFKGRAFEDPLADDIQLEAALRKFIRLANDRDIALSDEEYARLQDAHISIQRLPAYTRAATVVLLKDLYLRSAVRSAILAQIETMDPWQLAGGRYQISGSSLGVEKADSIYQLLGKGRVQNLNPHFVESILGFAAGLPAVKGARRGVADLYRKAQRQIQKFNIFFIHGNLVLDTETGRAILITGNKYLGKSVVSAELINDPGGRFEFISDSGVMALMEEGRLYAGPAAYIYPQKSIPPAYHGKEGRLIPYGEPSRDKYRFFQVGSIVHFTQSGRTTFSKTSQEIDGDSFYHTLTDQLDEFATPPDRAADAARLAEQGTVLAMTVDIPKDKERRDYPAVAEDIKRMLGSGASLGAGDLQAKLNELFGIPENKPWEFAGPSRSYAIQSTPFYYRVGDLFYLPYLDDQFKSQLDGRISRREYHYGWRHYLDQRAYRDLLDDLALFQNNWVVARLRFGLLTPLLDFSSGYFNLSAILGLMETQSLYAGLRVLDAGSGGGILTFTASRLGAGYAFGIDMDDDLILMAQNLGRLNGLDSSHVDFSQTNFEQAAERELGRFDYIAANFPDWGLFIAEEEAESAGEEVPVYNWNSMLLERFPGTQYYLAAGGRFDRNLSDWTRAILESEFERVSIPAQISGTRGDYGTFLGRERKIRAQSLGEAGFVSLIGVNVHIKTALDAESHGASLGTMTLTSAEILDTVEKRLAAQQKDRASYEYGLIDVSALAYELGIPSMDFRAELAEIDWKAYAKTRKKAKALIPVFVESQGWKRHTFKKRVLWTLRTMEKLGGITSYAEIRKNRRITQARADKYFPGIPDISKALEAINHNQALAGGLKFALLQGHKFTAQRRFVKALLALGGRASNEELSQVIGIPTTATAHHSRNLDYELWNYNLERMGLGPVSPVRHQKTKRVEDETLYALEVMGGFAAPYQIDRAVGFNERFSSHFVQKIDFESVNKTRALQGLFPLGVYRIQDNTWNGKPFRRVPARKGTDLAEILRNMRRYYVERIGGRSDVPGYPGRGYKPFIKTTVPWLYTLLFDSRKLGITKLDQDYIFEEALSLIIDTAEAHRLTGDALNEYFRTGAPRAINVSRQDLLKLVNEEQAVEHFQANLNKAAEQIKGSLQKFSLAGKNSYPALNAAKQEHVAQARKTYLAMPFPPKKRIAAQSLGAWATQGAMARQMALDIEEVLEDLNPVRIMNLKTEVGIFAPSDLPEVAEMLEWVQDRYPDHESYLSVGSGDGGDAILAARMGFDVTAVEYDTGLMDIAQQAELRISGIDEDKEIRWIEDDFFEADLDWDKIDVVFYYDRSSKAGKKIFETLKDRMRPGSILVVYRQALIAPMNLKKAFNFKPVRKWDFGSVFEGHSWESFIYRKKLSRPAAQAWAVLRGASLGDDAEAVGLMNGLRAISAGLERAGQVRLEEPVVLMITGPSATSKTQLAKLIRAGIAGFSPEEIDMIGTDDLTEGELTHWEMLRYLTAEDETQLFRDFLARKREDGRAFRLKIVEGYHAPDFFERIGVKPQVDVIVSSPGKMRVLVDLLRYGHYGPLLILNYLYMRHKNPMAEFPGYPGPEHGRINFRNDVLWAKVRWDLSRRYNGGKSRFDAEAIARIAAEEKLPAAVLEKFLQPHGSDKLFRLVYNAVNPKVDAESLGQSDLADIRGLRRAVSLLDPEKANLPPADIEKLAADLNTAVRVLGVEKTLDEMDRQTALYIRNVTLEHETVMGTKLKSLEAKVDQFLARVNAVLRSGKSVEQQQNALTSIIRNALAGEYDERSGKILAAYFKDLGILLGQIKNQSRQASGRGENLRAIQASPEHSTAAAFLKRVFPAEAHLAVIFAASDSDAAYSLRSPSYRKAVRTVLESNPLAFIRIAHAGASPGEIKHFQREFAVFGSRLRIESAEREHLPYVLNGFLNDELLNQVKALSGQNRLKQTELPQFISVVGIEEVLNQFREIALGGKELVSLAHDPILDTKDDALIDGAVLFEWGIAHLVAYQRADKIRSQISEEQLAIRGNRFIPKASGLTQFLTALGEAWQGIQRALRAA